MATNINVLNAYSTTNSIVQFNPVSQLPVKLIGSHKFSTWKAQISILMCGHNLFGHLDGTSPAPSPTLIQGDQQIENPSYNTWFCQDQLIHNAIMASVDLTIAPTIAVAIMAKISWNYLHTSYVNKTQTRIFNYLHQVRSLCDELVTVRTKVSNDELIVKFLSGLRLEFRGMSVAIRTRDSIISYEEL
ncbi:hypothetical protein MANES_08G105950v8 [Manihot esculenta]|uniref:Uncharacterized protein n=1 Tax=Manihot esculenta TaxID=3983 RepID=A0ACB7H9C0_MANES|nr:hypothetical protein MANES_08G105950v8 [Manihot esculenta]